VGNPVEEEELSEILAKGCRVRGRDICTFEVLTVMTSITQLATTTVRREMMFRTRMTFRII